MKFRIKKDDSVRVTTVCSYYYGLVGTVSEVTKYGGAIVHFGAEVLAAADYPGRVRDDAYFNLGELEVVV